jgi:hypothetical protein
LAQQAPFGPHSELDAHPDGALDGVQLHVHVMFLGCPSLSSMSHPHW